METKYCLPKDEKANRLLTLTVTLCAFLCYVILYNYVLFRYNMGHIHKQSFDLPNPVLALIGVSIAVIVCMLLGRRASTHAASVGGSTQDRLIFWLISAVFLIQLFICYNTLYLPGWDIAVLRTHVQNYLCGRDWNAYYLSIYPNNIAISTFLIWVGSIFKALRITNLSAIAMGYSVISCAVSSLTGYLLYRISRKTHHGGGIVQARTVWALYVLLIGFSPWLNVPYTDSYGLIFPALLYDVYISRWKRAWVKPFLLGLIGLTAYSLKATTFIMVIAILPFALISLVKRGSGKALLVHAAAFLLGTALAFGSAKISAKLMYGDKLDPELRFGIYHWMVLGLNESFDGIYNIWDVGDSQWIQTRAERDAMNLEKVRERISNMWPRTLYRFLRRKALVNFSDGTFSFGAEGLAESTPLPDANDTVSPFLQSLFHGHGLRFHSYATAAQCVWLSVLTFVIVAVFPFGKGRIQGQTAVLALYLVGVALYVQIFESRARYLYVATPIFCLCAQLGMERLTKILAQLFTRKRSRPVTEERLLKDPADKS